MFNLKISDLISAVRLMPQHEFTSKSDFYSKNDIEKIANNYWLVERYICEKKLSVYGALLMVKDTFNFLN